MGGSTKLRVAAPQILQRTAWGSGSELAVCDRPRREAAAGQPDEPGRGEPGGD